jgi:AcrR family transcriptional regulator
MSHLTDHSKSDERLPLAHRKRVATRQRIAASAARLVAETGLAAATVDRIADTAEVGRATFFRYFNTKEDAVAEGMNEQWLGRITVALTAQPADMSATEAVVAAFEDLGRGFADVEDQVRELATLTRSAPALEAWTLHIYLRYEATIAELIAPRMADLTAHDPRPRLLGALAMATVRVALDDWLAHGGSLPERVHRGLTSIRVA